MRYVLAIDQGTTSTRAIVFDNQAHPVASSQTELAQHYPESGWVEHDPEEIWASVLDVARDAITRAGLEACDIAAIGIANQRETTLIWDRRTGEPIHRAIVWQDRRTAGRCAELKSAGLEDEVRQRTGLLLDPYFSASKIGWILDAVPDARRRAEAGELAFGTIDSFILWRLTGGMTHATDATNASRTLLFNIHSQAWDDDLLAMFDVPRSVLPEVRDNCCHFGDVCEHLLGSAIPVYGMAGDQQAALIGQACFEPGMIKATYGTGCFMLLNTGSIAVNSRARLLTTTAYRLSGVPTYALEGSIFIAGAAIKWLRDKMGLIVHASDTSSMATEVEDGHGVYVVPAFVGLGAPHWRPDAKGLIYGLTLDTSAAHIARASLEAVAYQTLDLADAMTNEGAAAPSSLRIDGGMSANDWLCQFLADVLRTPVERPLNVETTALGAAFLAGMGVGLWRDQQDFAAIWNGGRTFKPNMTADAREAAVRGWRSAVARTLVEL